MVRLLPSLSQPAHAASLPATPTEPPIVPLRSARSAPVSRQTSFQQLAVPPPPTAPKLSARKRPPSSRTRPVLEVHSARTLFHLTQPAILQDAPRDLLAGTRALPAKTVADRLLVRLESELTQLKNDPAELEAVRARLTPRQPLTEALRARLKVKDDRIAELESRLLMEKAAREVAAAAAKAAAIKAAEEEAADVSDPVAVEPEPPIVDSTPPTPPRTPLGERPFAMSPTNNTGMSLLIAAFAEEAEERKQKEEAEAEAAALAAFEREAEAAMKRGRAKDAAKRAAPKPQQPEPEEVVEPSAASVAANATWKRIGRYIAPEPKPGFTILPNPRKVEEPLLRSPLTERNESNAMPLPAPRVKKPLPVLAMPLGAPFSERMRFTSDVRPVKPALV